MTTITETTLPRAGKPYRPSNGTEGMAFTALFCDECKFESEKKPCRILTLTAAFDIGDPEYPKQWIYGKNGQPTCTAFKRPYDGPAALRHDGACDDPKQMSLF